jgi:predicted aldo/keto reductase-like oxidoreductase
MKLDIPLLIERYNAYAYSEDGVIDPKAMESIEEGLRPSACVGCRSCEELCPQGIKISEVMADFAERSGNA